MPAMQSPFQAARLRRHADYQLAYGASRKHRSSTLSYFYREHPGEPDASARFGITTPRALGPAVLRNRIKRRLRAVAHPAISLLPRGVDVILHPRPELATLPFDKLKAEVEAVFTTVTRRVASKTDNTPLPRGPRASRRKIPKPKSPP